MEGRQCEEIEIMSEIILLGTEKNLVQLMEELNLQNAWHKFDFAKHTMFECFSTESRTILVLEFFFLEQL